MALDKSRSLDKSGASQRTKIEDTLKNVNKSSSISSAILYDKITKIEQPKQINVRSESPSVSSMSRRPEKERIPHNIKREKFS